MQICRNRMPGCPMSSPLIFAIRVIAESGSLYTLGSIFALCAVFISDSHSGNQYPLMMAGAIVRRQMKISTIVSDSYL